MWRPLTWKGWGKKRGIMWAHILPLPFKTSIYGNYYMLLVQMNYFRKKRNASMRLAMFLSSL